MPFRASARLLRHYDAALLRKYYPQELVRAVELAQRAIPPNTSFRPSSIDFAPPYYDDLARRDPFWDYRPGLPNLHSEGPARVLRWDAVHQTAEFYPGDASGSAAPAAQGADRRLGELAQGLHRQTLLDPSYIARLAMKPLVMRRVSNQTVKGKIASFYALVVVGDRNGMVGLGEGKSRADMARALFKAHWDAVRNIKHIPRYENRTIFGDIDHRYHGVKLHLRSAKPGFGLRVNHVIFEICECAGIRDLTGKIYKSRNPMNIAKGTLEALTTAQRSLQEVSLGRGKKLVDVRNVYYSA